jgi:hypothetical protein
MLLTKPAEMECGQGKLNLMILAIWKQSMYRISDHESRNKHTPISDAMSV